MAPARSHSASRYAMRNSALAFLIALPGILQAQNARLDSSDGEARIVVSVSRLSRIPADRAIIYLLVEGGGETPADAVQKVTQKLQAVGNAIKQSGVAVEAAQPWPYGITPAQNASSYPGGAGVTSYVARFTIRVQLGKPDQLIPLVAAAIAAGATTSSTPIYEAQATDSVRRARFAEALATARQDAETLASSLGGRLGRLIEVTSNSFQTQAFSQPYISFTSRFDGGGQVPTPEVQASASITVRYQFIPK